MNSHIIDWTKRMRMAYPHEAGRVLDIGSLNVNGSVRDLFKDATQYIGADFREGKEVDLVINAHDLLGKFGMNSFDTIICMDMLEHDDKFWITLENINTMLNRGGRLWIVQPSINFPIHNYPGDYWRATEQAFTDVYYKGYDLLNMEQVYTKDKNGNDYEDLKGEAGMNPVLCALGRKV